MNKIKESIIAIIFIGINLTSCSNNESTHDATGTFESTEIIVSSEANGKVLSFTIEEGSEVKANQEVGVIDGTNLELQKNQVLASMDAIQQKQNDAGPQIEILKRQLNAADLDINTLMTQLEVIVIEQNRLKNLYKSEAATKQQLDEINGQVDILNKQILAAKSKKEVMNAQIQSARDVVKIQNRGISSEKKPMQEQIAIINNQLSKTKVLNPIDGTILTTYINAGEFVTIGKPLYKLADITEMDLRAYITGNQLPGVNIGQNVAVYIDNADGGDKSYTGQIAWISDKAEFTPKTIQTKDERSNLVYAIKIKVKNDGFIKIGMYGEVDFKTQSGEK